MTMLFPLTNQSYLILSYPFYKVNNYFGYKGYAMVFKYTKKLLKEITRNAWIIYNQGKKIQILTHQKRHHTSSQ